MADIVAEAETLLTETRKAREALEAKGAFTDANAATHLVLALEALARMGGWQKTVDVARIFRDAAGE